MLEGFLQDATARTGALPPLVAIAEGNDDLGLFPNDLLQRIGLAGSAAGAAEAEDVGDDGLGVFAGFKGQAVDVVDEDGEQLLGQDGRHELVDLVG